MIAAGWEPSPTTRLPPPEFSIRCQFAATGAILGWRARRTLREAIGQGLIGASHIEMRTLTLMSAEETEMIEPVISSGAISLPTMLRRKAESAATNDTSLKNFLLSEGMPGSSENPTMKELHDARLMSPEVREALHSLFFIR